MLQSKTLLCKGGKSWEVVKDGLRFRLSSLGAMEMAANFLETLQRAGKHLAELEEIPPRNAAEKELQKERERGREIEG